MLRRVFDQWMSASRAPAHESSTAVGKKMVLTLRKGPSMWLKYAFMASSMKHHLDTVYGPAVVR
jgi:hypothetical protein